MLDRRPHRWIGGRPVALVRGAKPLLGEGSIRDAIMPREFDLFG